MIGYGFMGRAHSNAYRKVGNFFDLDYEPVLKAACGRNKAKTEEFAYRWGYESTETDWKKLIQRKDTDLIDICVPNDLHMEIAIAAAKAGKMVLTEKPIARNTKEGEKMVAAVEKAKVPNMVWYNYRRVPAVSLIKQVVAKGTLGRIYHYRANFLQDWTINPDVPQGGAAGRRCSAGQSWTAPTAPWGHKTSWSSP
jgi:predicted dehydrogenase